MSKKYTLDIDSYIGDWYSSKKYVKSVLAKAGVSKVLIRVNSLGGNLDDGIDIAAQFESHGDVTCELFALNASAATVLTTGAKTVRMHENASYLIHKVLVWVDTWGYMNPDDLDAAIEDMKQKKNGAAALTLTVARMYAKRSGKPVNEILNLMKEERWLSAQEAKDWGFVDEIFSAAEAKPVNYLDEQYANLLDAAGLPPLPKREPTAADTPTAQDASDREGLFSRFLDKFDSFFSNNSITTTMNKTHSFLNTLFGVEGLEFKNGTLEITEE